MKIAFIVNEFPSLSQTFVLNQITGLIDRGHEVDIFPQERGTHGKVHEDIRKYNLLARTSYPVVPSQNIIRRYCDALRHIGLLLMKNPRAIFHSLNFLKYGRKASSLTLLYTIIPFLDKGPYDIVHCHFGPCGQLGALLKELTVTKGKLLTTFHGYDMSRYLKKYGRHAYDSLFTQGDLFLPISEHWKNKLIELGCPLEKIVIHRMGIDTAKFTFPARKPKMNDKVQFLSIGRLVEKKGFQYSIRAVATIRETFPNIEYTIIGEGPLRRSLESLIDELHVGDCVHLLGWMRQDELVQALTDADILLAPSVTSHNGDQEGIPVALMEALALGLPVISTLHSGIPELIQDRKTGLLVPERDVDALSNKLKYVLLNQEYWAQAAKAGRKYVEENHEINKLNDQLVHVFLGLTTDSPMSPRHSTEPAPIKAQA